MCLITLWSCSDSQRRVSQGASYTLTGTLWQDSTMVDSVVTLIVDRHEVSYTKQGDTLPASEIILLPVVEGCFSYQGAEPYDVDELCLYDQHNHVVRLYGTSGARLNVSILQNDDVVVQASQQDTTDMLRLVLLRDSIPYITDSLYIRRAMGGLPQSAKPEWLMRSINLMLDQQYLLKVPSSRLPRVDIQTPDTLYPLLGNRSESLMMLLWSMEDSASVDSLQLLNYIAKNFGLYQYGKDFKQDKSPTRRRLAYRITLMSLCLYAPDSTAWKSKVKNLPGYHAILPGGYSHPLLTAYRIKNCPAVIVADRFGNYQTSNVWGEELYKYLEKSPQNSEINYPRK